jgi:hypothetical protein
VVGLLVAYENQWNEMQTLMLAGWAYASSQSTESGGTQAARDNAVYVLLKVKEI